LTSINTIGLKISVAEVGVVRKVIASVRNKEKLILSDAEETMLLAVDKRMENLILGSPLLRSGDNSLETYGSRRVKVPSRGSLSG
jgi:hypothetical protein